MIIGFHGQARAGKDTAATTLIYRYGFQRLAFADPLKRAAGVIFGLTDAQLYGDELKEAVDPYWGKSPRQIMQLLGTECLRHGFADDVWIKALFRQVADRPQDHYVITDVRFPNEGDEIKRWGGRVIEVTRPGLARMGHASENAMQGYAFDAVIVNDGTKEDLGLKVRALIEGAGDKEGEAA